MELHHLLYVPLLISSLGYSYTFLPLLPNPITRLPFLLPVFYIFSLFPWLFSSSIALRTLASFLITWIASFKLLLLCFDRGPLVTATSNFLDFAAVAIFPVKLRETSAGATAVARYEMVRLVDEPGKSTSLQEFWGRRWNRLASDILRQTVHDPVRKALVGRVSVSPAVARVAALMAALVVSGLMHEVMFYYITCGARPTWEVTSFFVLHGVCMAVESGLGGSTVASAVGRRPSAATWLTLGFVTATGWWLVLLPIVRKGESECAF